MRGVTASLFVVLSSVVAGCSPDESDVATHDDDIVGGRRDTEHEAVVYLGSETEAWCSGTLIAPDLVLTAAHCLDLPVTRVYSGTGNPRVMGTAFDTGNRRAHVVAATRRHQQFWISRSHISALDLPDLGLVRLAAPADIAPMRLADATPSVGETCSIVGFGMSFVPGRTTELGERKMASVVVRAVGPRAFQLGAVDGMASYGDSGGAMICGGELVGVAHALRAPDVLYDRVDAAHAEHRDWIRANADLHADWSREERREDGCPVGAGTSSCAAPMTCEYSAMSLSESEPCEIRARALCGGEGAAWDVTLVRCGG